MSNNLLSIFLTLAVLQNFVVAQFLGLCPFFGITNKLSDAFRMGMAVIFVMTGASAATWVITRYILTPYDILYMNNVVYILIIATLVQIVEMFIKRTSANLYNVFGVYLPLITTNCAVLGITFINFRNHYSFVEAMIAAIAGGVGFIIIMAIMAGIREKLLIADPPKSLKGLPQAIFVAMMLGLIFRGFIGIV
ncbi:electron transport complex protein RnfA [Chloroflexota bacterium]